MAQDTGGNNSAQTLVDIIRAYIIDNTVGAVNPAKLRTVLEAIANSVTASSGTAISATPPLSFNAFTNVFSLSDVKKEAIYYIGGQDETGFTDVIEKKNTTSTTFDFVKIKEQPGAFNCLNFDPTKHFLTYALFGNTGRTVQYSIEEGGIISTFGSDGTFEFGGWIKIEEII